MIRRGGRCHKDPRSFTQFYQSLSLKCPIGGQHHTRVDVQLLRERTHARQSSTVLDQAEMHGAEEAFSDGVGNLGSTRDHDACRARAARFARTMNEKI